MDRDVRLPALTGGVGRSGGNAPAVGEESHLDEMRTAIREDFARLAERRGDQKLMRVAEHCEEPVKSPAGEAASEPEAGVRRSWLARFVSP